MNATPLLPGFAIDPSKPESGRDGVAAPASGSPVWWTADDTEAVTRYREWEATDWYEHMPTDGSDPCAWMRTDGGVACQARLDAYVDSHSPKWTCRRCRWWKSNDGNRGECCGPELACGTTRAGDTCEQYDPANAKGEAQPPAKNR